MYKLEFGLYSTAWLLMIHKRYDLGVLFQVEKKMLLPDSLTVQPEARFVCQDCIGQ